MSATFRPAFAGVHPVFLLIFCRREQSFRFGFSFSLFFFPFFLYSPVSRFDDQRFVHPLERFRPHIPPRYPLKQIPCPIALFFGLWVRDRKRQESQHENPEAASGRKSRTMPNTNWNGRKW